VYSNSAEARTRHCRQILAFAPSATRAWPLAERTGRSFPQKEHAMTATPRRCRGCPVDGSRDSGWSTRVRRTTRTRNSSPRRTCRMLSHRMCSSRPRRAVLSPPTRQPSPSTVEPSSRSSGGVLARLLVQVSIAERTPFRRPARVTRWPLWYTSKQSMRPRFPLVRRTLRISCKPRINGAGPRSGPSFTYLVDCLLHSLVRRLVHLPGYRSSRHSRRDCHSDEAYASGSIKRSREPVSVGSLSPL